LKENTLIHSVCFEESSRRKFSGTLVRPVDDAIKGVLLYIDDQGYKGLEKQGFDAFVEEGFAIMSIEIIGMGDLYPRASDWDRYPWCDISRILSYGSWSMATSVAHLQISDVLAALKYLKDNTEFNSVPVYIAGVGRAAPIALMVTAIDEDIKGLIGINSLVSYRRYIEHPLPPYNIMSASYGVLKQFDIPIVLAAVADRIVLWADPVDAGYHRIARDQLKCEYHLAITLLSGHEDVFFSGEIPERNNVIKNKIMTRR
jgi:hypothetical protein